MILSGEIGVFVPRNEQQLFGEISAVERICRRMERYELDKKDIEWYLSHFKDDQKEFFMRVDSISEGCRVVMNKFYLSERLGGLDYESMPPDLFFNNVCF